MAYEKRDFAYFKKHLSEGGYVDIGGARKSIGKMAIPDEEKVAAEKLAVKHFGADTAPVSKVKKGKAVPRKAATKAAREAKAPKTPKAAATPPAAAATAKTRKTRGPGRKAAGALVPVATMLDEHTIRIGTIQQALKAMNDAKQLGAEASEVAVGARKAQEALTSIVSSLCPNSNEPTQEDLQQADALEKAARVAGVMPTMPGGNTQGTG